MRPVERAPFRFHHRKSVAGQTSQSLPNHASIPFSTENVMKTTNNTILITGGGSGIGRGLAEAFHKRNNQVIISGRRKERLQATADANPGMAYVELDISDPRGVKVALAKLIKVFPALNVLINNAGIMLTDKANEAIDDELLTSTPQRQRCIHIRCRSAIFCGKLAFASSRSRRHGFGLSC